MFTRGTITTPPPDGFSASRSLRKSWKGDIGLALFSPLDITLDNGSSGGDGIRENHTSVSSAAASELTCPAAEPFTDTDHDETDEDEDNNHNSHYCANEMDEQGEHEEPVLLSYEDCATLASSPRLLSPRMMAQIRDGLHSTAQIMRWYRPYSLSRDGDSFHTMMQKCTGYNHTIVVCKTAKGDILGGYADTPWRLGSRQFFGSGRAFLFATNPDMKDEEKDWDHLSRKKMRRKSCQSSSVTSDNGALIVDDINDHETDGEFVYLFKWTGNNTYSQVCSAETGQLAMGGGGAFGFIVQEHFSKGSTGHCSTFNNPRLTGDSGGCFDIVDLEVYGLKSCLFNTFASDNNLQGKI
mmetsp:Transcript_35084/g.76804  ORF Transcript_35084/g.76804 Transcript_35084/m.76804 type:complete len:353 (+) Transcript_35084:204-1262(+)